MQTLIHRHITRLDALTPADEPRSGAKAFNCARLKQAGFPVPDGLVVLATATNDDLRMMANDPWFDSVPANVKHATKRLRTGERVRLDAIGGFVQRLEPASITAEV